MLLKSIATSVALVGSALSQTPPGFTPQSLAYFPVTYDNATTAPTFFKTAGLFTKTLPVYAPQVFIPDISQLKSKTFLILMVDPDAPSPQNQSFGQILHWLQPGVKVVKNAKQIKGPDGTTNLVKLNTTTIDPIVPYRGPNPPSEAPHRYIFMLFIQPNANSFTLPAGYEKYAGGADRRLFNAEQFVDDAGLDEPIGGNYFLAGFNTTGDGSVGYTGTDAAEGATEPVGGNPISIFSGNETATATEGTPEPTETPSEAVRLGAGVSVWAMVICVLYFLL
ncbi:hypothetical protein ABW19_dt0200438 [Dactylella cylindrospora]|nr:hypothetical protein ABW19_dt0200438 [Dactylella cylindrospora]